MDNTFDIEQQKTLLLQQVMTVDKEMKKLEEQKKKRKLISDQNNITLAEKNIKISKHIDEGDYNLDELIWPDPNPEINQNVLKVDDVTQMNAKEVDRIFMVRTTEDVQHVLTNTVYRDDAVQKFISKNNQYARFFSFRS